MNNHNELTQVYLDANATTPVLPEAAAAALSAMETLFGNPSSSHITGLKAKDLMEQTRQRAHSLLGVGEGKLIFTSGATEGIQTAILSALLAAKKRLQPGQTYKALYGATEHKAVPESLKHWLTVLDIPAEIMAIPVDQFGLLDNDFIAQHAPNALMICTMAVNNETGVFQDLQQLEQSIRHANPNIFWMVDCVQALGKTALNLQQTTIDYAPFSGHKLYAPKGIGFVYIRDGAPFTPFIAGGGQESGLRSGTENLPGMAALNVIFKMLLCPQGSAFSDSQTLQAYRQQIANTLTECFPRIVFNNSFEHSVPTTINFAVPSFSSKEIMDLFDAANIRVSSGSACSSKVTRSFVLDAMGLPTWQSESAIRMSFGPAITQADVDLACERIKTASQALTQSCMLLDHARALDDKTPLDGLLQLSAGASCTWVYVDNNSKQALIIDPLPELQHRLDTLLQCQQLEVKAIIDTHGHADHVSGREVLANRYLVEQDSDILGWPYQTQTVEHLGVQYESIEIGSLQLVKVPTPGHTADSISLLLCEKPLENKTLSQRTKFAFCGDTILMGSLGRTNFDSSSSEALFDSLKLLSRIISADTLICASHDYNHEFTTNLQAEMTRNALLNAVVNEQVSLADFIARKTQLDSHLNDEVGTEIMCGAYVASCDKSAINEYDAEGLAAAINSQDEVQLIDIREPHEYALNHSLNSSQNVPLTRLVQFIHEQQYQKDKPWVLVCRSGSRSMVAAQAMHRLGFSQISHLKGGYALSH
ncbi:aminotransferase class V-fold PLP-dependent enzyme [Shewanella sp. Isolate13]|uniref:aminotransferase class V-fold PLP-dependent enzyme n=1 Tax=Shewanella sp. Isolate13 TaxID=2908531 RepID=UPI001EFD0A42|nr:aminotransferase class V-fold PLP-dependent enzyme [Shewanella sp. Isolate13]MCG9728379.1 aminotransferase class V-fold PLP-dependent enzyme [Shewanella sp. Isolate13]